MSSRHARYKNRGALAAAALVLVLVLCFAGAQLLERHMAVPISHAGEQITVHTSADNTAQVFVNGKWYVQRNLETLLVMGTDESGDLEEINSYNNSHQADFLALFLRDLDTGRTAVIHLNRDTMTNITTLGVTGQPTGTRFAQLALAYNYGSGDHVSSANVVSAVEYLLYGVEVDHYITVTMDVVPLLNDWAGGVILEVADDLTGIDAALVEGELVRLQGEQALHYVRARGGLDDSSNLRRMERQRQYASEWAKTAQDRLGDSQAVAELVMQMDGYYRSSCTAEQLEAFARSLADNPSVPSYEIAGNAVEGDAFMEFYVDETALQQLVLELFYVALD